jgi:hypothetical protein
MKPILLCLLGITGFLLSGCEAELPPERGKPPVAFGNAQFRDESHERPAGVATDREKTVW